jgi:hypothetical protein
MWSRGRDIKSFRKGKIIALSRGACYYQRKSKNVHEWEGSMAEQLHSSFTGRPVAQRGWWAFWLGVVFIVLFLFNGVLMQVPEKTGVLRGLAIVYGWVLMLSGLASGVLSVVALLKDKERSWMALLPLLFGLYVVFMLVGELLFPH